MSKTIHMCVSVTGALRNWNPQNWVGVCNDESGRILKPKEVKSWLESELAKGHVKVPCCSPKECPDFDYFGGGCPGHDYEAERVARERLGAALRAKGGAPAAPMSRAEEYEETERRR